MGNDDERAALIHQHATNKAYQAIARGLDELSKAHRQDGDEDGRRDPRLRSANCTEDRPDPRNDQVPVRDHAPELGLRYESG
ncbi:hypothetical protein GCM10010439_40580 [Actinocorallia aurantiaca]|uniref:Uncharacterized protein n=1 Tax=Actinocorallia aurantiaca TaxID=46204 RepID=A0ABN3UBU2_9ACTN